MNRRGIVNDIILWLGLIFLFGLSLLIIYIIFDGLDTAVQGQDQFGAKEKQFITDYKNDFSGVWDYTFLTVFIVGLIGLLILSWFLSSNPGLFVALLFVVVLVGIVGAVLSNAYEEATSTGVLSASSANFPVTSFLMGNIVPFVVVTAFLMMIVFFAKPGGDVA